MPCAPMRLGEGHVHGSVTLRRHGCQAPPHSVDFWSRAQKRDAKAQPDLAASFRVLSGGAWCKIESCPCLLVALRSKAYVSYRTVFVSKTYGELS